MALVVGLAAAVVWADEPPPGNPPLDDADPCQYTDPTLWGELCRPGGGGDNPCQNLEGEALCLCNCGVQYGRALKTCRLIKFPPGRALCEVHAWWNHLTCQIGCLAHAPAGECQPRGKNE